MVKSNVILDSDIIIWWLRNEEKVVQKMKDLYPTHTLITTPVSVAEVWSGLRKGEELIIEKAFGMLAVLQIESRIGRYAGAYMNEYKKSHSIQLSDALIAGCAIHYDCKLWTMNHKHYPMLKKENFI